LVAVRRICVIGGGTAGYMAVAHLSTFHPDYEIVHLFDSNNPTIGVGEGSTPDVVTWLQSVGIGPGTMQERCDATQKDGLFLEGWGREGGSFPHCFLPRHRSAIHFSASMLPGELARISTFDHIDNNAKDIEPSKDGAVVTTVDGQRIDCDLVIDARGFPDQESHRILKFPWIPTNAAVVTRVPHASDLTETRSVAMPNGWIFVIPLRSGTSFGYIFDSSLVSATQIENELRAFLTDNSFGPERLAGDPSFRRLSFPNFTRRSIFDGRVFAIGNAASFLEPLEATAIGVTVYQLNLLSHWLKNKAPAGVRWRAHDKIVQEDINASHMETMKRISLFIAWHYASGSRFDTEFWRGASQAFQSSLGLRWMLSTVREFSDALERAESISTLDLKKLDTDADLAQMRGRVSLTWQFGGFSELNFAQMARGLDWGYENLREAIATACTAP